MRLIRRVSAGLLVVAFALCAGAAPDPVRRNHLGSEKSP